MPANDNKKPRLLYHIIPAVAEFWVCCVAWILYGWFIQSLGAPHIGFMHMCGIYVLSKLFRSYAGLPSDQYKIYLLSLKTAAIVSVLLVEGFMMWLVM